VTRALRKNPRPLPSQDRAAAGVDAALRKLKPKSATEQNIAAAWSGFVPSFVEDFTLLMLPDRLAPPRGVTAAQLSKVKKDGDALLRSLMSLQGPAITALHSHFHDLTLGEFEEMLQRLITAAFRAMVPDGSTDRRGPKFRSQPRKIAALAADRFYCLTGRTPARTKIRGEFPDFLAEVFSALGISASVDLHAREAIRAWIKKHPWAGK
jgi:hypothetical protein